MDRFIAKFSSRAAEPIQHLKSNMDRFIGFSGLIMRASDTDLKSNMDRFIGCGKMGRHRGNQKFKIQYG